MFLVEVKAFRSEHAMRMESLLRMLLLLRRLPPRSHELSNQEDQFGLLVRQTTPQRLISGS